MSELQIQVNEIGSKQAEGLQQPIEQNGLFHVTSLLSRALNAGEMITNNYRKVVAGATTAALALGSVASLESVSARAAQENNAVPAVSASNKKASCVPGHIKLNLLGPKDITSSSPVPFTLVASSCKYPTHGQQNGVKLEEIGPGHQKKIWKIKNFHNGVTKRENFDLSFQNTASNNSSSPVEEPITIEAVSRKGKLLGIQRKMLQYIANQAGSTNPNNSPSPSPLAPGVYLTGPLTDIVLGTKYTYNVEVVPAQSYQRAYVIFAVPPSTFIKTVTGIHLVAGQPYKETITTDFTSTNEMSTDGIEVDVVANIGRPGYNYSAKGLFAKQYPVTPAVGQPSSLESNLPTTVPAD